VNIATERHGPDVVVRVAGPSDARAIAALRAVWHGQTAADHSFETRMAGWLAAEGERRTTWLAMLDGVSVGMASLFEYRRMPWPARPDSRWGYVSNMFVAPEHRNRGIGSALLSTLIATAQERGYARLVVSPSVRAIEFYRRAGFRLIDDAADADALLVRSIPDGG